MNDFGLSRKIQSENNNEYIASSEAKVPIRWLAPESLIEARYTIESDVYMFGSCLFEMFARQKPFYWIQDIDEVNQERRKGLKLDLRLHCPKDGTAAPCPEEIMKLMEDCLQHDPQKRPTMQQVEQRLSEIFTNYKGSNDALNLPKQPEPEAKSDLKQSINNPDASAPPNICSDFQSLEDFLKSVKCEQCLQVFIDNDVKLEDLPLFTLEELKELLPNKLGPVKRIHAALVKYQRK